MEGVYKGIKCRTGDQRIDGVWHKALIYECLPQGDDEQALTQAGFEDLENGLWVKVVTAQECRELSMEFEKKREEAEKALTEKRQVISEEEIKLEQQRHIYNERMASRRAKLRTIKLDFAGVSIFAEIISLVLIYTSVVYRFDADMKYIALPLWASLTFLPIIIVGAAVGAYKKLPAAYLVLAGVLAIAAIASWDTASIILLFAAAAFVVFYFLTRCITVFKAEPEYPIYADKSTSEFREMMG
jgi:hypothetical protein